MRSLWFVLLTLGGLAGAWASTLADFPFEDPARERAFRELTEELRCLVCQNESLAGSQAELAQDLRREVYAMMQAGQGKQDVIDFMVARYGDFVLYSPPLRPSTYPLWIGPFVIMALAVFLLVRTLRRRKARLGEAALSDADQARLASLLGQNHSAQKDSLE